MEPRTMTDCLLPVLVLLLAFRRLANIIGLKLSPFGLCDRSTKFQNIEVFEIIYKDFCVDLYKMAYS